MGFPQCNTFDGEKAASSSRQPASEPTLAGDEGSEVPLVARDSLDVEPVSETLAVDVPTAAVTSVAPEPEENDAPAPIVEPTDLEQVTLPGSNVATPPEASAPLAPASDTSITPPASDTGPAGPLAAPPSGTSATAFSLATLHIIGQGSTRYVRGPPFTPSPLTQYMVDWVLTTTENMDLFEAREYRGDLERGWALGMGAMWYEREELGAQEYWEALEMHLFRNGGSRLGFPP